MAWNSLTDTISVAAIRVAAPSATGIQTITISGSAGIVPVAALIKMSGATVNGTLAAHARMSIGATDGTNERMASCFAEDNAPLSAAIVATTAATPVSVESTGHNLTTGQYVVPSGTGNSDIDDNPYLITVTDANNYTLDGSSSASTSTGGSWDLRKNNYKGSSNAHVCGLLDTTKNIGGTIAWESYAELDSFTADSIKINWTKVSGAGGEFVTVLLLGGTHLKAYVGDTVSASPATAVTGPGWPPDIVLPFGHQDGFSFSATSASSLGHSCDIQMGAVANGGGKGGLALSALNGISQDLSGNKTVVANRVQDQYASYFVKDDELLGKTPFTRAVATINNFNALGFDVLQESIGDGVANPFAYLALKFDKQTADIKVSLESWQTGSGFGGKTTTGFGFKPQALIIISSNISTSQKNTTISDGRAGTFGIAFVTSSTDEYSTFISVEDGIAGTNKNKTSAICTDKIVKHYYHDDTGPKQENSFTSFGTDGFNWTRDNYATPVANKSFICVAIGEAKAPTEPVVSGNTRLVNRERLSGGLVNGGLVRA